MVLNSYKSLDTVHLSRMIRHFDQIRAGKRERTKYRRNNPHILLETTTTTQTVFASQNHQVKNYVVKPIRILPGPNGIVQMAKLRKITDTQEGEEESVIVVEYVNVDGGVLTGCFGDVKKFLKNGKLKEVIAIIKSCTLNALGDLTITLKDLSGRISSTIHYKVLMEESDEESLTSKIKDEEYAMADRDFKKFFKRRGRCGDLNHLIKESLKPLRDKNQMDFVGGSWSNSGKEDDEKAKDKTCLMAQASSETDDFLVRLFKANNLPQCRGLKLFSIIE
nr:hypothetical protein [Tanacetum cinerariifolium]